MTGQKIAHYQILDKLGEGGMGVVYKARDTKLDRFVAIKFLTSRFASTEEHKTRFLREAKAAAALSHPNILSVYEIGDHADEMFMVMEYIDGQTLHSHISNRTYGTGVPIRKAMEWVTQIAEGLKAAHERNIIHRDIKPQNVMIASNGQIKIMDFGLAKLKSNVGMTKSGTSLGTLSYMSPEQSQGKTADDKSDIWSLGVVFYEMLTGEPPFKGEHEAALLYLIVNEEPPAPSALNRKIPPHVDAVVEKMLQKDPDRRFQSAGEVIKALEDLQREVDSASTATKKKAIAVLPFDNISPEQDSDYFSDGLTEELIAHLSRLKDMRVVSRTTSMQYKGTKKDIRIIGRDLGARYIMEGSVRKYQDNLRITAQLIDVENDEQLWAETYKGKIADIFDIQEQVAKQIVDALMVKLTPTEKVVLSKRPTVNAEAFDLNLRARDFLYKRTKNGLQIAIQFFQKAIELDQRYAAAYAGLGEAYATLNHDYDSKEFWLDKAIESSLKALMYDPTLSEAYAALGLAYFSKKMIDEATEATKKAIDLDPNNFTGYWILARIYHTVDRDNDAVDLLQKVIELNPDFHTAYGDLRMIYERLGETEKYNEVIEALHEIFPRYIARHPDDARAHIYYGLDLAQVGKINEAKSEALLALQLSPGDPLMMYNAACLYARIGESQLAIESLKNSISAGLEDYEWIKRDPDFDGIRDLPEYQDLMKGK